MKKTINLRLIVTAFLVALMTSSMFAGSYKTDVHAEESYSDDTICCIDSATSGGANSSSYYQEAKDVATRSGFLSKSALTKNQVAKICNDAWDSSVDFAYETAPNLSNPYTTGKLALSNRTAALNYINMYRRIAGLDTVTEDDDWSDQAQHGAVVLAALNNGLSHYPSQPEDMDDDFYETGRNATSSSNLSAGYSRIEYGTIGQMYDNSGFNKTCLGHRRWLLYSNLNVVGLGGAKAVTSGGYGTYFDYKVFSNSYTTDEDWDFISWPSSGNFPTELCENDLPWSITLNRKKYSAPSLDSVVVTITNPYGVTETFDQSDYIEGSSVSSYTKYFNINNSGYGDTYCLICAFPEDELYSSYSNKSIENCFNVPGTYTVTVTGINSLKLNENGYIDYSDSVGKSVSISYTVNMFSVSDYAGEETVTDEQYEAITQFVERLYNVCLDREPDETGLNNWVNALASGEKTGVDVASGFIFSTEFNNHNYCNSCYVEHLYNAFMGRASDPDGKAYWINNLETGMTREEVFNGFALSNEFKNICDEYGIVQGEGLTIPEYGTVPKGSCSADGTVDGVTSFVTRLYNVCLDRDPDAEGLNNWTNALWNHETSGSTTAHGFIFSPEFTNKNYDDDTYVEYLYRAFFDRASDPTGKADWVSKLQNGASREEVFNGFTGSQEFMTLCAKYGIVR